MILQTSYLSCNHFLCQLHIIRIGTIVNRGMIIWEITYRIPNPVYTSCGHFRSNTFSCLIHIIRILCGTKTCSMLGQILMGILIDVLGLLCVTPIPLNLPRIGGCILVIVGIILVYRASNQNDLQGRHFRSISSARKIRLALLALAAGMGSAIQAPTNTALAGITGNIEASFFSFLGGVIFFAVILILRRLGFARRTAAGNSTAGYSEMDTASETQTPKRRIRPWMLTGGVYGASVVLFTIIATPNLGVALVLGLSMIGQLAGGLTVDTLGLLQAKRFPLVPRRLIGILLVTAGVILIAIGRISAL